MGIFDKWVDTNDDFDSSLPATGSNSPKTPVENNGMTGILSPLIPPKIDFFDATDKALQRYEKLDPTKLDACISAYKDVATIYGDVVNHFNHEAGETTKVFMQCQKDIEVASITAAANVQQAYYNFAATQEQCKKEIRIKELENEEGKRRHERYMKSLEYAWNVFIKSFDELSDKAKINSKLEGDVLKQILDTKDLEKQKNLSDMFIQLKDKNNEVLRLIAELRMQITITPER